ncbi:MAG: adaptor protein MecA [Lachnospira sp.]|nr:adaptor protein MecA [Lachnospira sp.]
MEFKKISDSKFQCLLFEEDLEENNISLDDFFRNDTVKIHSLLEVVMEKAHDSIGVELDGGVVSLQLSPQPNRSLLLTVSCGQDDVGDIIKQAGERAAQMISEMKSGKSGGNVIKKDELESQDMVKAAPFKAIDNKEPVSGIIAVDGAGNSIGLDGAICQFSNLDEVETFCISAPKTWGIKNALYKDTEYDTFYLVLERGRSSKQRFEMFVNGAMEYGDLIVYSDDKVSYMKEHFEVYIAENAVNMIKKYCAC